MTAVLSPTADFRRDALSPNDDPYGTNWRQKYLELEETLAETRQDLEEFQQSSKELEEEMTLELERTERAQQELQSKVARLEIERDEWKSKFISLQTNHNTTTTSLQKEIDTLRQQLQNTKVQLRELEIGNDDLERNERAVMSSLADVEIKYSRVLEEKILLEQELLDKASLEEQMQRLKDELRDANEEISNLKRLLEQAQSTASESGDAPTFPSSSSRPSLEDNLLETPPPNDLLLLSDLGPEPQKELPSLPPSDSNLSETVKPRPSSGQTALLSRAGFPSTPAPSAPQSSASPSALPRPANLGASRIATPKGYNLGRSMARASPSNLPMPTTIASKSKGVQMISALRSRVQTTQQRLIPGIPRLRLGSNAGRTASNIPTVTAVAASRSGLSIGEASSRTTTTRKSADSLSGDPDRSSSPGWVFIQTQDDSPFPGNKSDEWRASSPVSPTSSSASGHPSAPSSFKPKASTRAGGTGIPRRPPSRLSIGSESSPSAHGSRLSGSSRPATPTFLPVPTQGIQAGAKRSTGPNSLATSMYNPRRSSLDTSKRSVSPIPPVPSKGLAKSTRERPTSFPAQPRTTAQTSGRTSALGQSRIGKPSTGVRRSTGGDAEEALGELLAKNKGRLRAGSTSAAQARGFRP